MRIATIAGPLEIGLDYRRYIQAARRNQVASPVLDPKHPHNIGDWFVTTATDRLLDYSEAMVIRKDAPQRDWDVINSECDVLVLKGGNYIQRDWLTQQYGIEMFRKIKIPIVMFGVGLQAGVREKVEFAPEEAEILRFIHASTASSSVRGESTAEALSSIGIHNSVVTGCPTTYWSRKPEIELREAHTERGAFSFRQGLYSDDPAVYASQFRAIEAARDQFSTLKVILQGEELLLQQYLMTSQWGAEHAVRAKGTEGTSMLRLTREPLDIAAMRDEILHTYGPFAKPSFLRWFMDNTFFSYDVGDYLDFYRAQGMVVGCRLHSNLVSIANGTPTFFLTYDQRTTELAELLELPNAPVTTFNSDMLVDFVHQDWSGFRKQYTHYYGEMRRFLDENHLAHNLPA
jgi:polysaccharide pyruvyl transferase WcaK-like protein